MEAGVKTTTTSDISVTTRLTNVVHIGHTHSPRDWTNQDTGYISVCVPAHQTLAFVVLTKVEVTRAGPHLLRAQTCCTKSHFLLQLWWKSWVLVAKGCLAAWPCIYCSRASIFFPSFKAFIYIFVLDTHAQIQILTSWFQWVRPVSPELWLCKDLLWF